MPGICRPRWSRTERAARAAGPCCRCAQRLETSRAGGFLPRLRTRTARVDTAHVPCARARSHVPPLPPLLTTWAAPATEGPRARPAQARLARGAPTHVDWAGSARRSSPAARLARRRAARTLRAIIVPRAGAHPAGASKPRAQPRTLSFATAPNPTPHTSMAWSTHRILPRSPHKQFVVLRLLHHQVLVWRTAPVQCAIFVQ